MSETLRKKIGDRLQSGATVLVIVHPDEILAMEECKDVAPVCKLPIRTFSVTQDECAEALQKLPTENEVLILKDYLAVYGENPMSARLIREVSTQRRINKPSRLILIEQPSTKIPPGIVGDSDVINVELPDNADLVLELELFIKCFDEMRGDKKFEEEIKIIDEILAGNGEKKFSIASALSGLHRHEAARLLSLCWKVKKTIDPSWLRSEKAQRVSSRLGGALSFDTSDMSEIGGYDLLKADILRKKAAFGSLKAKSRGLSEPRGIIIVGPPGTGKSAVSRYIAKLLGLPLLVLDIGKMFGSLVGQSESQTRQALQAASACSPCVMRIDELEKALGGGGLDGGTTTRVTGTVLTWQQEHTEPVFTVATVNSTDALPPELTRAGRFDAVYFMDLPDVYERREIVGIHVKKRNRNLEEKDMNTLAEATEGYSGAEIEQVIIEAMFVAYAEDPEREITIKDLLMCKKQVIPLSVSRKDRLEKTREWAKANARPTSSRRESSQGSTDTPQMFRRPSGIGGM